MLTPTSPPDEVTFRPPHAPTPKFAGMTPNLPSALRELRRRPKSTARPGEMTTLANRIGGIRLDHSPDGCSPSPNHKGPHQVYPLRLEFAEPDDSTGKENISTDNYNPQTRTAELEKPANMFSQSRQPLISPLEPVERVNEFSHSPQTDPANDRSTECQSPMTEVVVFDLQKPRNSALSSHDNDSTLSHRSGKKEFKSPKAPEERITEDKLQITDIPVSSSINAEQATVDATPEITVNALTHESRTLPDDGKENSSPKRENPAAVESEVCTPKESEQAVSAHIENARESINTSDSERVPETEELDQSVKSEPEHMEASKMEEANAVSRVKEEESSPFNKSKELPQDELERFMKNIDKVKEGKARWKWPYRCEALKSMSDTVDNHFNHEVHAILCEKMPTLAGNVRDHLGELRPSIITAVLAFVDSIMLSSFPAEAFARKVLPGVIEIASGHSLRACDAARSLALALDVYPSLNGLLDDVENSQRLLKVVEEYCEKEGTSEEMRGKAQNIVPMMQKTLHVPAVCDTTDGPQSVNTTLAEETKEVAGDEDMPMAKNGPEEPTADEQRMNDVDTEVSEGKENEKKNNDDRMRYLRYSRMSWRAKLETPSLIGKQGILNEVLEGGGSALSNRSNRSKQGRESTSDSPWKGREYTQEEVDEIRHAAIEAVIDKLGQAHSTKCEKMERENIGLQQKLEKERSDNAELQSVLEEFEMTMSKMVSEGNSQANAQHLALQSEKNLLKGELLEVSNAFEKIKERYEVAKQTIELMETKESRLIERNQELKNSMVDLQTWSNDLKANTEKKLNKAFESVTFFRSSCLEQEAHAAKAMSDLKKMTAELEKASASHRETATKLAQCESDLHIAQDARTELNGQLLATKASLQRMTANRDSLQTDMETARQGMNALKDRVGELESISARLAESQKQLDAMRFERQELKARAFDDMTRVRSLERQLESKEKELDELGVICEDAMSALEQRKWEDSRR